ncbi:hypothetical protein C7H61_12875 [Mesoflavibacter zeaxanthinifaciens subsp. sabulilitoris]|uniref:Uncharacterized protein n=1 Tax=Mesoflavibacter zeaxanthinifaciens subsp. sabulilitoris TaxID=1520893 RepID=A0A2T1N603_9FLAO|nr:hypothetical protein C7H61_12875 [Mesoflavibacter zeaxanthinifaciens subsp. sabulilitoris]
MIPYPYIIKQNQDSIFLYNHKGLIVDKIISSKIKKHKTVEFKEKHFKILNKKNDSFYAFDLLDSLNFRPFKNGLPNHKNSAKFIQVQSNIDIGTFQNDFKNSVWEYKVVEDENSNPNKDLELKQTIKFNDSNVNILTNYYYQGIKTISESEIKEYNIFKIDDVYFLSYQKEVNNPQTIYQIVNYNSSVITLRDYSSREVKDISFNKTQVNSEDYNQLINESTYYSNCFDGYQGEYYYGEDVTFNKGNEYLMDYLSKDAPISDAKSGYIIIHFNINCKGNVGRFGLIQMDKEFKKTAFSNTLIKHLLNKVRTLNDFPSSNSQMEWLYYKDVHAFLMFKLHNGKIIDLCP